MTVHRALWLATLALLLVGAAPNREVEDLIRLGNEAFARKDYAGAVALYEQAEELATDPGQVSFNKAAALYHLTRYREAEQCYRRCLDDGEVPPSRRARALYDLGTSLLQVSGDKDAVALEQAVHVLRQCRRLTTDSDLAARAEHNLELARLLWAKARAAASNSAPNQKDDEPRPKKEDDRHQHGDPTLDHKGQPGSKGETVWQDPSKGKQKAIETQQNTPGKGKLDTLPDDEELHPLHPHETSAHLERAAQRIARDQRDQLHQAGPPVPGVKDW
ncbi:MAG: tetratricopeptide repeat protein [Gemmataceae bacterium]|nr:tetratricopeptide repeat protein [Gemmataceae bacterium]